MPRKRLTFTVEEATYREIVEDLDADESVDDWVREAIADRLADDPDERSAEDHDEGDSDEYGYDEPEPLEFVDDCSI